MGLPELFRHCMGCRCATEAPPRCTLTRAIQAGTIPDPMNADQRIVHDFVIGTIKRGTPSDAVYDDAVARFGREGVLELIVICGYYSMLAMLLNTAQLPLPEDTIPPLREKI